MKTTLTLLTALLLAPVAALHAAASASRPMSPERPKYPAKMAAMTDADFGRLFFVEIQLDYPGLENVKRAVTQGDYPAALAEWSNVFNRRVHSITLDWPVHNWYPAAELMGETARFHQSRYPKRGYHVIDLGKPGALAWHSPKPGYNHAQNYMWHPQALIGAVEQKHGISGHGNIGKVESFTSDQLLARWADLWRDFANHNWRIGMELFDHPDAQAKLLKQCEADEPPAEWLLSNQWRSLLPLAWLVDNFNSQLNHAVRADPDGFPRVIAPRSLAEIVYFMALWPAENLADVVLGGVPNQRALGFTALLATARMLPEFKRSERWLAQSEKSVRGYLHENWQPDGSDSELSYNYNGVLPAALDAVIRLYRGSDTPPAFVDELRHAKRYRELFLQSLNTPWGRQVLCKGSSEYGAQPTADRQPPYAGSIAFPWHGLYLLRQGWGPEALFASLVSPRRGNGHEADHANVLTLEAYGRRILIANPGESLTGPGLYTASSWGQCAINVDGLGQNRFTLPRQNACAEPIKARWHASLRFDLAETFYTYGYGRLLDPKKPDRRLDLAPSGAKVTDVSHTRRLVFVREASLFLVFDEIACSSQHTYSQVWKFSKDYPNDRVTPQPSEHAVFTSDPKGPNLFLYHAGTPSVRYRKFYGEGAKEPRPDLETLGVEARGWHYTGSGYGGPADPAVDVHAEWTGTGPQRLLTILAPSPDAANPVTAIERASEGGLTRVQLTLRGGTSVFVQSSDSGQPQKLHASGIETEALMLIVCQCKGQPLSGVVLGAKTWADTPAATPDFEFTEQPGRAVKSVAIRVPAGFRWRDNAKGGIEPDYAWDQSKAGESR